MAWSLQAYFAVAGGIVVAGNTDGNLYGIDAKSGEMKWSHYGGFGGFSASPTVMESTAFIGTRAGEFLAIDLKVGAMPAQTRDGRLLVFYRSAYGNWNHGVAPLVALGLLDVLQNRIAPLEHQYGRQPAWNTFWGEPRTNGARIRRSPNRLGIR